MQLLGTRGINWTRWLEPLPHGLPHMFVGYSMATMWSPDDPIFWLHHCNLDRLWHLWMDCNGWDKVTSDKLTCMQYEAWNPVSISAGPLVNPVTGIVYPVGPDDPIPFTRDSNMDDTVVFPGPEWPTPRSLWSCGTATAPGHDGIYYRYGVDQLVRTYSKSCPDSSSWTLVDVGYVWVRTKAKRDFDGLHPVMQEKSETYEAKLAQGKSHQEVLHEMAMTECEKAPKNDINPQLEEWIKMMNHVPEDYDSLCDKPSLRLQDRKNAAANQQTTFEIGGTAVPLWLIIVACVSCVLVLIGIITVIIISVRRKSGLTDDYRQM